MSTPPPAKRVRTVPGAPKKHRRLEDQENRVRNSIQDWRGREVRNALMNSRTEYDCIKQYVKATFGQEALLRLGPLLEFGTFDVGDPITVINAYFT